MKRQIEKLVKETLDNLASSEGWPVADRATEITIPKKESFGDFSVNSAMTLAASLKTNPRKIAEVIVKELETSELLSSVSIAGPGFINMTVKPEYWVEELEHVLEKPDEFGNTDIGGGKKVMVEFVSANPTGPLHIGHGRGAAVGDVIARILSTAGYEVLSEYYINDVGLQMDNLGRSAIERAKEILGQESEVPTYKGEYMIEVAQKFLDKNGEGVLDKPEEELLKSAREFAAKEILDSIKADLVDFRVNFDEWFSESTLHDNDEVENVIEKLIDKDHLYEKDGAIWLKTEPAGDEKDRVVRRANGITTYLAADIAYHKSKFERGFDTIVNVWGADHHGYIPRMRAVISALGHDPDKMAVRLVQIVNLKRGGKVLPMSTREGVFTTLREIIDEVGVDATRYFFLMRSADSHLDFDVDLAKKQGDENPVFYVQYAHARCANIFLTAEDRGAKKLAFADIDKSLLTGADEIRLIRKILELPDFVASSARLYQPHLITQYLAELSTAFHYFYAHNRVVTDDSALTSARLLLVEAVKTALARGLWLVGVKAPDKM